MADSSEIGDIIQSLISYGKEGQYWDFKLKHHKDKHELLHDLLCLANTDHDGSRYLIFGVSDDAEIFGIENTEHRRTQADIIDFLRSNQYKFAFSKYPDVRLEAAVIEGKSIDVIVIENSKNKPFYLIERISELPPHFIYSRNMDANTPKNNSAQPFEIERMWRERFGLNLSTKERVQRYLLHYNDWESSMTENGNTFWFHKLFPEFTIHIENAEDYIDSSQEWTRGEIRQDNNFSYYYSIYYHQTRLGKIQCVSFDDGKKSMIAPNWEPLASGRIYFYEVGSLIYAMQLFHVASQKNMDDSTGLNIRITDKALREKYNIPNDAFDFSIPIASQSEIENFKAMYDSQKYIEPSTDKKEQYALFLKNHFDFLTTRCAN